MSILVTGAAGFIGFHLCKLLIEEGFDVIGFDNLNNYYDQKLKKDRLNELKKGSLVNDGDFIFIKGDLGDDKVLKDAFQIKTKQNKEEISIVVHLAAQAGVRYSIENPSAYVESNLVGFCNIIEHCRINKIENFIYASSSSVYGSNKKLPFEESDNVDHPISLYAATKKSNELIAHTYSHLFNLPTIGLRFFTVYGPWGRPDMALFKFTDLIVKDKPIRVFNHGKMVRDFTYVDDIVEAILRLLKKPPIKKNFKDKIDAHSKKNFVPYKIFNIGNSQPTNLKDYIIAIENNLEKKAKIIFEDIQPGDVEETYASTRMLSDWIDFKPNTSINSGIKKFIEWYMQYYKYN